MSILSEPIEGDVDPARLWAELGLQLSGKVPLPNLSNAVAILERDERLQGLFYYDEFLKRVIHEQENREWSDKDDLSIVLYIQRKIGIGRIGREQVAQAVMSLAHKAPRHCVREWLDSLEWDGTARITSFFADVFGAPANAYTHAVGANFWKSLVARAYRPGCKVDNMVVLEGAQGIGKSQALQRIALDWFAEMHESATNPKGFAEILDGKLLVEISEMDAFNKAEVNRVKQAISCPSDRYRPAYGHRAIDHPRQCIFVGTTNRDDWNRDETGARRFWPIECVGDVRLDIIEENREQLFAEAKQRHWSGEPHWIMPAEDTREQQEARFAEDPWIEAVQEALKGEVETTTNYVAEKLKIDLTRQDRHLQMRLGGILRRLRWERKKVRVNGKPANIYVKR